MNGQDKIFNKDTTCSPLCYFLCYIIIISLLFYIYLGIFNKHRWKQANSQKLYESVCGEGQERKEGINLVQGNKWDCACPAHTHTYVYICVYTVCVTYIYIYVTYVTRDCQ